ncbi:discoidin domain-containing protein [Flindersiella endophytica]
MRRLASVVIGVVIAVSSALAGLSGAAPAGAAPALPRGSEDALAKGYYRLLLQNTRFQETLWNEAEGTYGIANWDVVGVLGNAVLLEFGTYDAAIAGVDEQTLRDHTIRSIAKAAAQNRFVDPGHGTWGAYVYWDAAFEAYLVAAAKLVWDDLDAQTHANIETILRGEADYLVQAGANPPDPSREGGTTNGLIGGYRGDTKAEEMGNRTMMLAAADAYLPADPSAAARRDWLDRWTVNMTGLPVADQVNPTEISGKPISEWATAQNIFDTYTSENHDTWNGMYQQSAGAYPGRNLVHYLISGRPVPTSQLATPSNDEMFRVLDQLGTSSGVPAEHMIGDRAHLYGRSLLPLTYRAVALGDRMSARAEQMLAGALVPYVEHPPAGRLIKFQAGTKYETEARAEVAMSYLLHYWRGRLAGDVSPVSEREYFARASGVTDYGEVPGLLNHQTATALASTITKPGYVKFAFLPQHDDWFVNAIGKSPVLLPSVVGVDGANRRAYSKLRDGIDATATVVRRGDGYAGFTTLPDGSVVYATTGTGDDEGWLRLFNFEMNGVPGLDGDRTYYTSDGQVTLAADGLGDGGSEELTFPATQARYVRMQGLQAQSQWGYSIYEFEARDGAAGANLALGKPATASTYFGDASVPAKAVDGDRTTRWANSAAERTTMKGWFAVDLGASRRLDRVLIHWQEDAWPLNYRIEVSDDGTDWRTVASVPDWQSTSGTWLNIDGRTGFTIAGSTNPIGVSPTVVSMSHGPAAGANGMVVRGFPVQTPAQTAAAARSPQPSGGPVQVRSALNGDVLSLFNLSGSEVANAAISVPQQGSSRRVYLGSQTTTAAGTTYQATLAAGSAAVEAPRFVVGADGSIAGLGVDVADSRTVTVTNRSNADRARVTLTSAATGERRTVSVARGTSVQVPFSQGLRTPANDLALGRTTYPSSPLPPGMSDPDRAVDGNPETAWTPGGADRRLVVNLGTARAVERVDPVWSDGRKAAYTIETSTDGVTWIPFTAGATAKYVSVRVTGWKAGAASLGELSAH